MLRNYLNITLRLLVRNRIFSGVNLFGLGIGFTTFLLIFNYFSFETSFDRFHEKSEELYRVTANYTNSDGIEEHHAGIAIPLGPQLSAFSDEVVTQARMFNMQKFSRSAVVGRPPEAGGSEYHEEEIYFVDPSFLELFSYQVLSGSSQPLAEPNSVVITGSTAEKYFGSENPVGQELILNRQYTFTVSGVIDDPPLNSHQQFDILFFIADGVRLGLFMDQNLHLFGDLAHTYIQVRKGTDIEALNDNLTRRAAQLTDRKYDDARLTLQPITDIHLHSDLTGEMQDNGSALLVYALGLFAFVTLLLAWSNYINLTIVKSSRRIKEIGIRKVLGAKKRYIFILFLLEAVILNMLALLLAFGLAEVSQPYLNELLGYSLPSLFSLPPFMLSALSAAVLLGILLSGIVPGLMMWALQPAQALKGKILGSLSGVKLRYGLVTFQMACVFILLAVSLGIYQQVHFMLEKELEVDVEQVLVIRGPGVFGSPEVSRAEAYRQFVSGYEQLKSRLLPYPAITGITSSNFIPGDRINFQASLQRTGTDENPSRLVERIFANYDFHSVYGLDLLAGRYFMKGRSDDTQSLVLNESAVRLLGFPSPVEAVGENILYFGGEREIVGVVKDFHFNSLKYSLTPLVFIQTVEPRFLSVRLNTAHMQETLDLVREQWGDAFPSSPFEYFFADDHFNRQYRNVLQARTLISGIALLTLLIACFGLFGLAYERIAWRIREISIRKILGASAGRIMGMLYLDFLRPLALSFLVALPVSWYLLHEWVAGFAYRITVGPGIFMMVGGAGLLIALATVSWQSVKAALANPVDSLRSE